MRTSTLAICLALALAVQPWSAGQADTRDDIAAYVARIRAAPDIDVSPEFRAALIAAEDRFFDDHAPQRSALILLVATFALPPGSDRTTRLEGGLGLAMALGAESLLKAVFMDVYLGKSCTGIVAAADAFYGAEPRRLTLAQSVVLASVLKAPSVFAASPERHADRAVFVISELALAFPDLAPPTEQELDAALHAYAQSGGCAG